MLAAKVHVFSDSGQWFQSVHQKFGEQKAEAVMTSDNCKKKKRDDIAGQSIDIDWHVCSGDKLVQILHKLQEGLSETGVRS